MKNLKSISALFMLMLVASCHQSSETSLNGGSGIGGADAWVVPGVGTEYVFTFEVSGDSGSPVIDTIIYTIVSTGQQVGGKSNVVRFLTSGSGQSPSSHFYAIESNGNFSVGDSITPDSIAWTDYPTGTRQTISDTPTNTVSFGEQSVATDVRSFIGAETLTTAAGNFSTLHVRDAETSVTIDSAVSFHDSEVVMDDYWFAPSIGFFVKSTATSNDNGGPSGFNEEFDIIKYMPK
jgi:hypothetical protein